MHWKDSEYTAEEIKKIYHKWLEIEKIIICEECNKICKYERESKQIKCRCGKVDLKNEIFYK
jgi:hypothetical protein